MNISKKDLQHAYESGFKDAIYSDLARELHGFGIVDYSKSKQKIDKEISKRCDEYINHEALV